MLRDSAKLLLKHGFLVNGVVNFMIVEDIKGNEASKLCYIYVESFPADDSNRNFTKSIVS